MIAKIVPLKRLPKQMDFLDYLVPEEEVSNIQVGQLVTIPFRKSTVYGLVFSLTKLPDPTHIKQYKPIISIVQSEPMLSAIHLTYLDIMSKWFATSLATITTMALPPLQKRKLQSLTLSPFPQPKKNNIQNKLPTYHQYHHEIEHKEILQSTIHDTTLILVPEVSHIAIIQELLVNQKQQLLVWHSDLSQKEQFTAWQQIRNQEKTIIVGTRGAIFLPFPKLDTIIVDYEQKENHKHWDQNPRFHVKDCTPLLANLHGAKLHIMSYSPSAESYFHLHKNNFSSKSSGQLVWGKTDCIQIIDMHDERRAGNKNIFSEAAEVALHESTEDIFIHLNRRGFATAVICQDCGHILHCTSCKTPMVYSEKTRHLTCHNCRNDIALPPSCPSCHSALIHMRGFGIEQVETIVRNIFTDIRIDIQRIDSETKRAHESTRANTTMRHIIIGTDAAFSRIDWPATDCIIFLDLDSQLAHAEYRNEERVWQRLQDVLYYMPDHAKFLIQTHNPRHLVCRSLSEPDRFYRTTLNLRKTLLYPPYSAIIRLFYGHIEQNIAKQAVERLRSAIETELTKNKKKAILSQALEMQPHFYRRKFWHTIIVRFPPENWQEDLIWLNSLVPADWKVDPNPLSLLNP